MLYDFAGEFYADHSDDLDECEERLFATAQAMRKTKDPAELKTLYDSAASLFDALQKYCYAFGEGGKEYFDSMWMHCSNSKNQDFCFLDPLRERMERYCNITSK
jgi:hypothetical protein